MIQQKSPESQACVADDMVGQGFPLDFEVRGTSLTNIRATVESSRRSPEADEESLPTVKETKHPAYRRFHA